MPPGPAYNTLAVLYSLARILEHAAQNKTTAAARALGATESVLSRASGPVASQRSPPTHPPPVSVLVGAKALDARVTKAERRRIQRQLEEEEFRTILGKRWVDGILVDGSLPFTIPKQEATAVPSLAAAEQAEESSGVSAASPPCKSILSSSVGCSTFGTVSFWLSAPPSLNSHSQPRPQRLSILPTASELADTSPSSSPTLTASKVPSSRIGRLFHYGGDDSPSNPTGNVMLSEANIKRLVSKLTQMRGAALKLGQFMSIQDTHLLPPELDQIFRRVQDKSSFLAAYGPSWCDPSKPDEAVFLKFERIPFAAASIGQVMSAELTDECSYTREASFLKQFRSQEFLGKDDRYKVPWVWEGSTDEVLVMEHVGGVGVGDQGSVAETTRRLSQKDRDDIAERVIELCLKELFEFRTMQTDPNWTNFLWNNFGATRSINLGYLTGEEDEVMLDAHPISYFASYSFQELDLAAIRVWPPLTWAEVTKEIRSLIPVMLNRKLSGAFLLAARLDAKVDTKAIWDKVVSKYEFGGWEEEEETQLRKDID
ncbi:atypical/ABC1/ABC1-A protein kinase [Coprinopsis sp. MPI-PUGE-AT-0042]|nr:atypical/ABC1/ABC1-A protein kinase [Coprinopsis sp. MPI-PUGE-AT-0042]